jgi:methionine-R-sulfoxide reductase
VPWINSDPLTLEGLRGRVVLVDFWTFSCYNCRNTLPTLKRFDASYRERGLTIVGVQTPEFDSEKKVETVRGQVRSLGIKYPVVLDNDYVTWRAYGVQAWPTVVILDKQGRIRYTHIGEGAYDMQEKIIKALLAEGVKQGAESPRGATDSPETYKGEKIVKTEAEWRALLSAEQYRVMRDKGTERAFTGEYNDHHESGTYHCAACDLALFNSKTKFESGTGWPSFFQPIAAANVTEEVDSAFGIKAHRSAVQPLRRAPRPRLRRRPPPDRPALLHELRLAEVQQAKLTFARLISEKDAVHDHERHPNNYAQYQSLPAIRRFPFFPQHD